MAISQPKTLVVAMLLSIAAVPAMAHHSANDVRRQERSDVDRGGQGIPVHEPALVADWWT